MSGETTHYKVKYAAAADEVKAFPGAVSQVGAETIDKALWEGNKVAAEQTYSAYVERTAAVEYEPSVTRATFVVVSVFLEPEGESTMKTPAGNIVDKVRNSGASGTYYMRAIVPAGAKWVAAGGAKVGTIKSSYLLL